MGEGGEEGKLGLDLELNEFWTWKFGFLGLCGVKLCRLCSYIIICGRIRMRLCILWVSDMEHATCEWPFCSAET